ncbi:TipJ family phage tail tip protein [Actinobacillus pleuropneumoniae]|uniref:TipJ family phage tail tip protein n=1 Tax=Actinobacillus pleuropneumoniae TaxID=715 RepID=UPI002277A1B2|nr:phage tail protein [Actinobacillus pleuropneumoniae]MCY6394999.1 phage tail protein [Actinobacillus pleuropneumoniae]MCY6408799.1 phage tail protein [Actinobacillus pleuropneumoniae]MCY6428865.1 phage tail protein [Actinobacillus pleuropneumoniae]
MGGKKQGSARTPHEAPDSLKSAQRLRAIGLISLGPIKGTANKWKSTFFDNTPIQNENGIDDNDEASFNFKNTEVSFTLGTQDQLPLQGFEMSEREVSVSTEVKYTTPITRTVTDPDVTRLRVTLGVNALYEQNDQGDTNGTSVSFRILINGLPRATYEINGKSSSRFYRSYIVDNLPERPFTITVERMTADSKSQRLQNATNWVSYTEIIDTKLSYPNMALVGIKTDSRYNPNFPNVNFLLYGRLVKVPSTYDPETRTYATALWKGDWKQAWTNNPAWVFYDLVTDPLAGLGKRVGDYGLDKFQLYQIAKYCDELVDDGYGGKEPRMTANLWLTDQRSAYDVLSDMASVFRAIAVWNGTQFTAIQDRTADPVCTYSQANVIDGKFSRQYAAMKSIYTAAEVEYADERNMYQKAVEYVADDAMIARYGYNVKKMTAYATTSRGQAHRLGKWVLATSLLEQCTITFSVGRQGLLHLPGDIIEVADNDYAGKTLGGRVVAVNGKVVTLDQPIEISGKSYLSYLNDEMKVVKVTISSVDSKNKAVVTLATVPTGLEPMDDWVLKTPNISTQLYRAIGITENDDGSYTITALQHEPQKEAIVDGSASFVPVATTAHTGGVQKVANAEASIHENGVKLTWAMPSSNSIVKYEVRLYRNGVLYQTYLDVESTELTFDDLPDGSYVAEIRSKNTNGQLSDPVTRAFEINLRIPRFVTKSLLFAIELDWDLPKTATVGNYTELWRSPENDVSKAVKVATLAYPQNNYTINGVSLNESYYFFARCGNKSGNKGEFTDGVFGEADHNTENLVNALEGKITQSHLGKSLIESLKADIDEAVGEESQQRQSAVANVLAQLLAETQARAKSISEESKARTAAITAETSNRTKAIQAESASLTKKIQDEANARGTAITQLQQTDAQQAQLITTVTAKADQAIAGLQEEKTARANADKAEAQARNALTSRVANAESGIAEVRQSIATANSSIAEVSQNLNAKIDGLSVGGRNYLEDTEKFERGLWAFSTGSSSDRTHIIENGVVRVIGNSTTWKQFQISAQMGQNANKTGKSPVLTKLEVGKTYTFSIDARLIEGSPDLWSSLRADSVTAGNIDNFHGNFKLTENWQRFQYTGTISQPVDDASWRIIIGYNRVGIVEFRKPKFELGTVATDWSPAPEDLEHSVEAISADLTNYKSTQATKEQATAQQISGLTTRLANTESGISRVEKAVSDNQSSTATQLNQLSANVAKSEANFNAKIDEEKTTRASGDKANADKITEITSRVNNAESTIRNIQLTTATKKEVSSIAQNELQSVWKADMKSAVDSIVIGGRNYILDSQFRNGYWHYTKREGNDVCNVNNGVVEIISTGNYWHQYQLSTYEYEGGLNLVAHDTTITLSVEVQSPDNCPFWFNVRSDTTAGPTANPIDSNGVANKNWQKVSFTGKLVPTENHKGYRIIFATNNIGTIRFRKPKLEIGNVATDWTPAPEDADSALNVVSSKVNSVQQTLTTANQALGSRIDTVTASVDDAKSQVSQVSKAVSDVSGKLSATHTLKTQVINGGRMAIAGIALGAESDGVTTESSVIVMADKFGIVANANDGKVKPVFSVANGQVGIRGDLVVAGSVTRDKLSGGAGENLLYNPIFANNGHGWTYYVDTANIDNAGYSFNANTGVYQSGAYLPTENQFRLQHIRKSITGDVRLGGLYQDMKLTPNTYYCFSVYTGGHRSYVDLNIEGGGIQIIHKSWSGRGRTGGFPDNTKETGVENWYRIWLIFKTNATNSAETNYRLIINTWGQNGQDSPMFIIRRPMLEECNASSTEPSPWSNAGAGPVHGGSIIANTIRGEHIQANQRITAPMIEGGSLNISNRFKVSNSGQVEMRSNSGNVGMVMNNDAIIVYDEWGKPRVKIGKLS